MWEQMTRIEIPMSCKPHSCSMKTSVVETNLHMFTNENPKL
jgi:hypothetical protein